MCSLTLALTGLTTGLQMAGQYQQSRAQAAALNAQADAAEQNARIVNRKQEQVAEQYAQQQRKLDDKRRLVLGQQTAEAGAAGVQSGVGSSLDLYMTTMNAWREDSTNLLTNQRIQQNDLLNQQYGYEYEADVSRSQAKAAKQAGNWAMFGSALTFLGNAYSSKLSAKSASTGTAQTPTAPGYEAGALDTTFGGMSGYSRVTQSTPWGIPQKAAKVYDIGFRPKRGFNFGGY